MQLPALTPEAPPPSTDSEASTPSQPRNLRAVVVLIASLLGAMAWAYWPSLDTMARKWQSDPQYSHGYLVPLFSIALLWLRRSGLKLDELHPSLWGLPLLLAAAGFRLAGTIFYFDWLETSSLLACLSGIALCAGGWTLFRWSLPAVAFLFFMIPLPFRVEIALHDPLRAIGTSASVYTMQTLGIPAIAEDYVIVLDEQRIGVAEACSGLRMLMIFFALTTAMAMLSPRVWWERCIIWLSAVPIALISNVARISVTGSLYWAGQAELAETVFHDLAGWLMMPFALCLLWGESWLLTHLIIEEVDRPVDVGIGAASL